MLGKMRQKYRYPVAFSYQVRNAVMHRLPHLSDRPGSFVSISIADGYLVSAASYRSLVQLCKDRNEIRPGEVQSFKFIDNSNQCLLQVIDLLQTYTDACAVDILEETINPLIPISIK